MIVPLNPNSNDTLGERERVSSKMREVDSVDAEKQKIKIKDEWKSANQ